MITVALIVFSSSTVLAQPNARTLIENAMNHWRGLSSYSEMTMVIHRPDWERSMSMAGWSQGNDESLIRVTAPAKDAGNGTLLKDKNMWSYAPKINRVIKVPSSMMSQSWMGSDLSNDDISKSTEILDAYDHTLLETREEADHTLYVIESVPHEDAAVVWGKQVMTLRDDNVILEEQYWDQDNILVKVFTTREIKAIGGRSVATVQRMQDVDKADEWTEIKVDDIQFDIDLPANLFTLSSLRNPRR